MSTVRVWLTGIVGILLIGIVDYGSGVELRTFPLYFLPVSLVAWHRGRAAAAGVAALCSISWLTSNLLAGLTFSTAGLWIANTLVQGVSFATVGLLIATLREALVREQDRSRTDPVTSIANSRAFYEEAGKLLAMCRRSGEPVTIAYVDLDHFKAVNDTLGHRAGDDCLRRVAGLMRASLRPSDALARLGGDEFALLLPRCGADDAAAALARMRLVLERALGSSVPPITVTIGAVTFMAAPETLEEMIHAADCRMYAAKAAGRNRVDLQIVPPMHGTHASGFIGASRSALRRLRL